MAKKGNNTTLYIGLFIAAAAGIVYMNKPTLAPYIPKPPVNPGGSNGGTTPPPNLTPTQLEDWNIHNR